MHGERRDATTSPDDLHAQVDALRLDLASLLRKTDEIAERLDAVARTVRTIKVTTSENGRTTPAGAAPHETPCASKNPTQREIGS